MTRGPKQKTHCIHGHELTPENTVQLFSKDGTKNGRRCKRCHQARMREVCKLDKNGTYARSRLKHQNGTRYGWDYDREAVLRSQGNACSICGRTDCTWGKGFNNTWHTDHDPDKPGTHESITCAECNIMLGRLKTASRARKFTKYLEEHRVNQS